MAPELIYFLKVNAAIALFYAFYKLLCRDDTFFGLRRGLLLFFLLMPFVSPLLNFSEWTREQPALKELAANYALFSNQVSYHTAALPSADVASAIPWSRMLVFVYLIGVAVLGFRFIVNLMSIFRQFAQSAEVRYCGVKVRVLSGIANPFSFFSWIFISPTMLVDSRSKEILIHECTHVHERHSIDVLLSEIITIFCWVNPFAWLMKKEIRLNLEYLADSRVMTCGCNPKSYQYQLLGLSVRDCRIGLYNNFNVSHLKRRIVMMNKMRTRSIMRIKYILFVPLVIFLLLISNIETVARTVGNLTQRYISPVSVGKRSVLSVVAEKDSIYNMADEMPWFKGDNAEWKRYLENSIRYPHDARMKGKQGLAIVQFVVEKDGEITQIHLVRKLYPSLDTEAVRVISSMPRWTPGKMKGKIVRCKYTLPIFFHLPKNS